MKLKLCLNIISRLLSLILIIFYILVLLYIHFGKDEDYKYYSREYMNCLKIKANETKREVASSPWKNEEDELEEKCDEYNKIYFYFLSYLFIYVYIILNIFQKFSFLIIGSKTSCELINSGVTMFTVGIYFFLFLLFNGSLVRPKTGNTKLIIIIINILINIILIIILIIVERGQNDNGSSYYVCLDTCFKIKNEEREERINNEISTIERKNNLIKEEIQNIIMFKKRINSNQIEDKKIEVILWYVKNTFNKQFSPNILYKYLLEEMKDIYGKLIYKSKIRKIFLSYIKKKFEECLTCPITNEIFKNPEITPEGQTFDNYYLSKSLNKKEVNPLSNTKLCQSQLIKNSLVKKLCVILAENPEELSMVNFNKMKKLLINPENNKFYSNPVVIEEGDKIGETKEGIGTISKYSNKVILNIIEENKDILSDEFFEDLNENNINNLYNTEESQNMDIYLNINTNSKII